MHPFQYNNVNYLLPLRADIRRGTDIEKEAFKTDEALHKMQLARKGLNIMILDACRDSIPEDFFKNREIKGIFKGVAEGFSMIQAPSGSLIAYSTAPKMTSWGGLPNEKYSVYTKHLISVLETQAQLSSADLFVEVRRQVMAETKHEKSQQVPWEASSLTEKFCFEQCGGKDSEKEQDDKAFAQAVSKDTISAYKRYLLDCNQICAYRQQAKNKIAEKEQFILKAEQELTTVT